MIVNIINNVNGALASGLRLMDDPANVDRVESRVGTVIRRTFPVVTVTEQPRRRVLFSPVRNANPFFHFMEALWMLAGRNDLPWLAQFNKRMAEYSDDGGKTQPAAYGHRWRTHFGYDQIEKVVGLLRDEPTSRRAVISMWDTGSFDYEDSDIHVALVGGKDIPCNTTIYFNIVSNKVDMTVCCRSNDLWWGAHGANAVHMSILQEYVAAQLGLEPGTMRQLSNDYHLYTDILPEARISEAAQCAARNDRYLSGSAAETVLFYDDDEVARFDSSLPKFMNFADPALNPLDTTNPIDAMRLRANMERTDSFVINDLAYPMLRAWDAQRVGAVGYALDWCNKIGKHDRCDWRIACFEWVQHKFAGKA